jgi:ABC transport system ATP-binding/permease protein
MNNPGGIRTVFESCPRIDLHYEDQILSFNLTEPEHYLGREPAQTAPSGLKAPPDWVIVSRHQAMFRKIDDRYFIYDGDGVNPSSNRLFINNRLITPTEGYQLQSYDEIRIGQNPEQYATLSFIDPLQIKTGARPLQRSLQLRSDRPVVLGRADGQGIDLALDAPTISRKHASIEQVRVDGQQRYLLRNYSPNGVFVDRQEVTTTSTLNPGAVVKIGPYTFVLQNDELVFADRGDSIRLDAEQITRIVQLKQQKRSLCLLNDVSLAIEPGQFVALVGGSGAGKSTLLRALLGIEPCNSGTIYLNGDDLASNFNIYRNSIGYVPQSDIVHTNLQVREVLTYAARLRLPPDADIPGIVENTLHQIELSGRQNTLVKNLSGGQLKRVSIGVELLTDPKLFFLDEPTSGLDPGLDKKMMQLLRKLADKGRTIVLVTHATSNITLCDRIALMGLGGNLCYFGPPKDAIDYFQIPSGDFADIYIQLETADAVLQSATQFKESTQHHEYVASRLSVPTAAASERQQLPPPQPVKQSIFKQTKILTERYLQLIRRDPVYLGLSLLTAPLGIELIAIATQAKDVSATKPFIHPFTGSADAVRAGLALKVLFVFTCAAIWVGLAGSLQEIIKESAIYLRERLVNLRLTAYIGSKVAVLGGLALIQSILVTVIVLIGFKSPSSELIPWPLGLTITTFLTIVAAFSLGLTISAGVKNSSQANSALPILLLPQIIFAGVLFNMEKVPIGQYLSWLTIGRWSIGAYASLVDVNLLIPPANNSAGLDVSSVIERSDAYNATWANLGLNWGILLLHTAIYLGVANWLLKRKDVVKERSRRSAK